MTDKFVKEGLTFDDVFLMPGRSEVITEELKTNSKFIRITNARLVESHPHDVSITKKAPNYQVL